MVERKMEILPQSFSRPMDENLFSNEMAGQEEWR